jgi:hypothetical protein
MVENGNHPCPLLGRFGKVKSGTGSYRLNNECNRAYTTIHSLNHKLLLMKNVRESGGETQGYRATVLLYMQV